MPLKWHLADASEQPVTDLTMADITLTVDNVDCDSGAIIDPLEMTLAGGSGLQNLGNGDYQLTLEDHPGLGRVVQGDDARRRPRGHEDCPLPLHEVGPRPPLLDRLIKSVTS